MTSFGVFDILDHAEKKALVQAVGHEQFAAECRTKHTCLQVSEDIAEGILDEHCEAVLAVNLNVLAVEKAKQLRDGGSSSVLILVAGVEHPFKFGIDPDGTTFTLVVTGPVTRL